MINTTHWKVRLLSLLFAVSTVAGTVLAQDNSAPAPGFISEQGGRGNRPAVAQSRADLRTHTLYRPVSLPAELLPLLIWGNGGCLQNHYRQPQIYNKIPLVSKVRVALVYIYFFRSCTASLEQDREAETVSRVATLNGSWRKPGIAERVQWEGSVDRRGRVGNMHGKRNSESREGPAGRRGAPAQRRRCV